MQENDASLTYTWSLPGSSTQQGVLGWEEAGPRLPRFSQAVCERWEELKMNTGYKDANDTFMTLTTRKNETGFGSRQFILIDCVQNGWTISIWILYFVISVLPKVKQIPNYRMITQINRNTVTESLVGKLGILSLLNALMAF